MSNYGSTRQYRDDPNYREYRDDNGRSVTELTEQIRSDIVKINSGANSVERAMKNLGTERDSPSLRDRIHDTSLNTNKIVKATARLLGATVGIRADKQQKIQLDLLRSQFQDAVKRFQRLQQEAANKVKSQVTLGVHLQQPVVSSFAGDDDKTPLFEETQQRTQMLKEQEEVIEDDLALIREREERIHQLEADILDVNEIFRELGALISAQGEVLDTIDNNVERAAVHVSSGNEQLIKAADYQRRSRKKMCCIIVILLVVAVIITVIIVVSLKA